MLGVIETVHFPTLAQDSVIAAASGDPHLVSILSPSLRPIELYPLHPADFLPPHSWLLRCSLNWMYSQKRPSPEKGRRRLGQVLQRPRFSALRCTLRNHVTAFEHIFESTFGTRALLCSINLSRLSYSSLAEIAGNVIGCCWR